MCLKGQHSTRRAGDSPPLLPALVSSQGWDRKCGGCITHKPSPAKQCQHCKAAWFGHKHVGDNWLLFWCGRSAGNKQQVFVTESTTSFTSIGQIPISSCSPNSVFLRPKHTTKILADNQLLSCDLQLRQIKMFSAYLCLEVTMVEAILTKPGMRMCCSLHFKEEEMGIGIRRQCICARELTRSKFRGLLRDIHGHTLLL